MKKDDCLKRIEELESEIQILKKECSEPEPNRKFKIGDWVCFDHGEYPGYFSREVAPITHLDYTYSSKGIFQTKYSSGGGCDDDCLRFAHPDEIAYAKSGLPFVYNKGKEKYELIEIKNGHFKIGGLIDSRNFRMMPKEFITFLMNTRFLNKDGEKIFSAIYEKL